MTRSVIAGALFALLTASAAFAARPPVIVVDPGHGGSADGASSPTGALEKNLCLQIAKKVKAELQTLGAKVLLTRDSDRDVHLAERVAWANKRAPDLFISIHANSMPTKKLRERVQGIETYFLSASASGTEAASVADRENAEAPGHDEGPGDDTLAFILADLQRAEAHVDSSRLAYAVHQKLIDATHAPDHGVQQAPFYVLNGLAAPAILVEVGYISHPAEAKKLADTAYQQTLAKAIAQGVKSFLQATGARDAVEASVHPQ